MGDGVCQDWVPFSCGFQEVKVWHAGRQDYGGVRYVVAGELPFSWPASLVLFLTEGVCDASDVRKVLF